MYRFRWCVRRNNSAGRGTALTRWKDGWLGFGGVEAGGDNLLDAGLNLVDGGVVADGDDAVGFAGGDLFVLVVDAAVEVVGLALEAVFVGALFFDVALVAAACAAEGGFERGKEEEGEVGLKVVAGGGVHGEDAF